MRGIGYTWPRKLGMHNTDLPMLKAAMLQYLLSPKHIGEVYAVLDEEARFTPYRCGQGFHGSENGSEEQSGVGRQVSH